MWNPKRRVPASKIAGTSTLNGSSSRQSLGRDPAGFQIQRRGRFFLVGLSLLSLAACNEMVNQPKAKPFQESDFFADGRASRPRVPGTVARGQIINDELRLTGQVNGKPADLFPSPVTAETLARGRERFDIYCAPCHDRLGSGNGMVVRRGMPRPPSFHDPRLVKSPAGYFVNVMTKGFGRMDSYADRLSPDDRWAVAAYIRALQASQDAPLSALTPSERERLNAEPPATSTRTALGDLASW